MTALLALLLAFQQPVLSPASDEAVAIRLERGGCFGACPVYSVEVNEDGRVAFLGERFVALPGEHSRQVDPELVATLAEQIRSSDFFSLEDEYDSRIDDTPVVVLTVRIGDEEKSVIDNAGLNVGMPDAALDLQEAVDRVTGATAWIDGDDDTVSLLEAENYDFSARRAGRALVWLAWYGPEQTALDFLDRGAPLVVRPEDYALYEMNAIEGAARNGYRRLLTALIARGELTDPDAAQRVLVMAAIADVATLDLVLGARDFDDQARGRALVRVLSAVNYRSVEHDISASIDRLLETGPDVRVADAEGATALHNAPTASIVNRLIALGADIEATDEYGTTPIFSVNSEEAALALLDAGADVAPTSQTYETLLQRADRFRWPVLLARLRETL